MIDKETLLKKLDECEDDANEKAQYWNDYYEDSCEDFYYQGYARGVEEMAILMRSWLNDNN